MKSRWIDSRAIFKLGFFDAKEKKNTCSPKVVIDWTLGEIVVFEIVERDNNAEWPIISHL